MRKILLITIALIVIASVSRAQSTGAQTGATTGAKSVYFELGGPGIASFNYDFRFGKRQDGFGARVGFGGFYIEGDGALYLPLAINYLAGKDGRNYFELGAGVTPVVIDDEVDGDGIFSSTFGHLSFGYRLQPATSGFTFRATITPVFGDFGFFPLYAGVSFGYKF